MPMYEAFVVSVNNLSEMLEEISNSGFEIISTTYASDSQQVIIFCKMGIKEPEKPGLQKLFKKENSVL